MGRLTVELIPRTLFFSNVRTLLPKKYWNIIRKDSYDKAENKCEICGDTGKNQGYRHNVKCHQVKHFGRTSAIGKQAEAFKHMEKVNNWNHKECVDHLRVAMSEWMERSKYQWFIDLSYLNEKYEIPKKLINEAEKKRK